MTACKMLFSILIKLFILFSLSQTPALAIKKSYIVYMGAHSHGPKTTKNDLRKASDSHYEFLGSFLGSKEKAKDAIFYSYKRQIDGFAAMLDKKQAAEIAKHPKVVSVFLNERRKLQTTHSWNFLSLENSNDAVDSSSLWKKARYGEDLIIGTIDSGVWPESESFSDKGYGPIPAKWRGMCQNNTSDGFPCNRKLIGARYYYKGYAADLATLNSSEKNQLFEENIKEYSARDYNGHGSHTLSTAGGNFVPGANVFGFGNGTVKGGSPRARVASYKACWPPIKDGGCYDADLLKAFDHAIHDGVDVISVSIGAAPRDYFEEGISIGAFHAVKHGIVVVGGAGNSGTDGSVANVSPWIITVAASAMDRELVSYVELRNGLRLKGKSISKPLPKDTFYPLITGAQAKVANASDKDAILCREGTLDPQKVKDKILVCLFDGYGWMIKGREAISAGAVGMILCEEKESAEAEAANPEYHLLTTSNVNYKDGLAVFAYINSTNNPLGMIKPMPELGTKPAPFVAYFSSRGPNNKTAEILKPDITAPGVNILAAFTGAKSPSLVHTDERRSLYNFLSGTSMACPHVAGIVSLLKAIHPNWSPAAIRSAIMTTARTRDNTGHPMQNRSFDGSFSKATPFAYGAGHIRPTLAADPGLVYDLQVKDYKDFLCALGYNKTVVELFSKSLVCSQSTDSLSILNLNYPSITVPKLSGSNTVSRTVKNVGSPSTYTARIRPPPGISVTVQPNVLKFKSTGEMKTFYLTLKAKRAGVSKGYSFGELLWSDGVHNVRSPITVATVAKPPVNGDTVNRI